MVPSNSRLDWSRLRRVFAARVAMPQQLDVADPALAWDLAEERAAIMEYEGGLTRNDAEQLAGLNLHPVGSQPNY